MKIPFCSGNMSFSKWAQSAAAKCPFQVLVGDIDPRIRDGRTLSRFLDLENSKEVEAKKGPAAKYKAIMRGWRGKYGNSGLTRSKLEQTKQGKPKPAECLPRFEKVVGGPRDCVSEEDRISLPRLNSTSVLHQQLVRGPPRTWSEAGHAVVKAQQIFAAEKANEKAENSYCAGNKGGYYEKDHGKGQNYPKGGRPDYGKGEGEGKDEGGKGKGRGKGKNYGRDWRYEEAQGSNHEWQERPPYHYNRDFQPQQSRSYQALECVPAEAAQPGPFQPNPSPHALPQTPQQACFAPPQQPPPAGYGSAFNQPHFAFICREARQSAFVSRAAGSESTVSFVIDSGSSQHLTGRSDLLQDTRGGVRAISDRGRASQCNADWLGSLCKLQDWRDSLYP